jgi:Spy/CpxP family protein refolding chaperone
MRLANWGLLQLLKKDSIMATKSLKTYIGLLTAVLAIGSSVLLVTESTMAQPAAGSAARMDPTRMDKMVEKHVDRMVKTVNATPEQKTKLLSIAKAAQADIKPMHEQIRTRMDLAMTQSKEVLTPEQQTKWDEKMKSHRGRMGERMKKNDSTHTAH